ncbi:hypothetical protein [Nocardia sp. CA-120079]|uniref:hypothetical protein n=1 Tax=Nocardia sp. CA-120079 TaxID=3239974 RepID=UPI003D98D218
MSTEPFEPPRPDRPSTVPGLIGTILDAFLFGRAGWKQALLVVFLATTLTSVAVVALLMLRSVLPW